MNAITTFSLCSACREENSIYFEEFSLTQHYEHTTDLGTDISSIEFSFFVVFMFCERTRTSFLFPRTNIILHYVRFMLSIDFPQTKTHSNLHRCKLRKLMQMIEAKCSEHGK